MKLYYSDFLSAHRACAVARQGGDRGDRRVSPLRPGVSDHLETRDWMVGGELTVADFTVALCLPYAEGAKIPLDDFPVVRRWHDRLSAAVPVWTSAFPER